MTDGAWEPDADADDYITREQAKAAYGVCDGDVPWWAVALLPLRPDTIEHRTRSWFTAGMPPAGHKPSTAQFWEAWRRVVDMARQVAPADPAAWTAKAYDQWDEETGKGGEITELVRHAARSSVRAFLAFAGIVDDEDHPIVAKDFHVRTVRMMREEPLAMALLPFEFGKSWNSTIVVPLMDWAEWPDAQEGRIYLSEDFITDWPAKLQHEIEYNENLHQLFPWIRKPRRGDPSFGLWSQHKFAIGGRRDKRSSFEALTLKSFPVGKRFHRTGGDDWVNSSNARSIGEQDKFFDYLNQGALTTRAKVTRASRYKTQWGSFFLLGTVYDRNDVNYRAYETWQRMGRKVLRFDIFPEGHRSMRRGEVLWPERRPLAYVKQLEGELGERAFRMRCRNLVESSVNDVFNEKRYLLCERDDFAWGQAPPGTSLLIGLDPGKGRTARHSKNPAIVLYGLRDLAALRRGNPLADQGDATAGESDDYVHLIRWERMEGVPFTRQCERAIEWSRYYHCPVAVEDNNVQIAYADYIRQQAPDVEVVCHTTQHNKRDSDDGIETFVPLIDSRRLVIHAGGAPQSAVLALRFEFVRWPTFKYCDLLMAAWIARYQHQLRRRRHREEPTTNSLPWYVTRRRFMRHYPIRSKAGVLGG